MIDIYFVRHGETGGNVAKRLQPDTTRLTVRGEAQARAAGKTVAAWKPTHFLVSTQVRAVETARLMEESLSLIPETNALFQELIRPDAINGHYHRSLKTIGYLVRWYFGRGNADGSNGEGESYQAFRRRLRDAKQYLKSHPDGSRIVVVSHSVFINLFIAHMCHEEKLSPLRALIAFAKIFMLKNTGIMHVRFAPELVNTECPWRMPKL
jgi:broad specificity phosphatase PhoE